MLHFMLRCTFLNFAIIACAFVEIAYGVGHFLNLQEKLGV